ncbi:hypothetical protein EW146_g5009 [Bondarzewia mesenterica]|uniref:TOG domain-containing protein n=1 Tax=Bondarzewia mesenterica TaxID=1095465 RepID=A0A4V3XEY9_9AGAM|nr:hypothetical protein EW146_g5009 [Bondarzewia mesenterica]
MPPKVPQIIKCNSESDLQHQIALIQTHLLTPETEENWETIATALLKLAALSKGGACDYPSAFTSALRPLSRAIISAASSERSRLSAASIEFICAVAIGLGKAFEPLLPLYFPTLLSLCARPNKVFITRAKTGVTTIIEHTQLLGIISFLVDTLKDKSVSLKLIGIEGILACLNCFNPPDLEKESRAREIEIAIRVTATDANGDVRKASKKVFGAYKILHPTRVDSFAAPLSPVTRKYLDIKPKPPMAAPIPPRPQSSQSTHSVSSSLAVRSASALATVAKSTHAASRTASAPTHNRATSSSSISSKDAKALSTSSVARPDDHVPRQAGSRAKAQKSLPDQKTATRRAMLPPPLPAPNPMRRSQSEHQIVSRPGGRTTDKTAATQLTSSQSTKPAGALVAFGGARRLRIDPESTSSVPSRLIGGVQPPQRQVSNLGTSGPLRPPQQPSEIKQSIKERPLGGARRVPLPVEQQPVQTKVQPPKLASMKGKATVVPSTAKLAITKKIASSKPMLSTLKGGVKLVPPTSKSQPKSTAASSSAAPTAPIIAGRNGGVTKPTISQLARIKATAVAKKPSAIHPKTRDKKIARASKAYTVSVKSKLANKRITSVNPKQGGLQEAPSSDSGKGDSTPPIEVSPASTPLPPSPPCPTLPLPASIPATPTPAARAGTSSDEPSTVSPASTLSSPPIARAEPDTPDAPSSITAPPVLMSNSAMTPVKDNVSAERKKYVEGTPISTLLSSIQHGFLFTPSSPLSPPQSYARNAPDVGDTTECWSPPTWPTHMLDDIGILGVTDDCASSIVSDVTPKQRPTGRGVLLAVGNTNP